MAGNPKAKQKLLFLAKIFEERTDEEHPLSAEELIQELARYDITAERKSIYNDIEILIDFGMEIEKTRSPKSGFYLADRQLQLPEVRLLFDAVQSAEFITAKKSRELLSKLSGLVSDYQADSISRQVYIDRRRKQHNEEIYYSIDAVHTAIREQKKIRFVYCRREIRENGTIGRSEKNFVVSPYALLWSDDRYYVVCNNAKYDDLMHLRVDRMRHVEVLNEPARSFEEVSEYRGSFDIADYSSRTFNAFGGTSEMVELRCKSDFLEQILDHFGEDIHPKPCEDGACFTFRARLTVSDGLAADLLKFGDKVEVLSPPALREKMIGRLHDTAALYAEGDPE